MKCSSPDMEEDAMEFKMTKELNDIFRTCNTSSLSPKDTALVTFAAKLASGHKGAALGISHSVKKAGASVGELARVACLSACTAGPKVGETFASALKTAKLPGSSRLIQGEKFQGCTMKSLDTKTHHLVSLAACLASGCVCASGHIIQARNAGATQLELTRTACIASCVSGMKAKFDFLAHVQRTANCRACAC
jgi:alkylhydroperoxidase/carboxymuconolactone decarboxylase family protein YurZ